MAQLLTGNPPQQEAREEALTPGSAETASAPSETTTALGAAGTTPAASPTTALGAAGTTSATSPKKALGAAVTATSSPTLVTPPVAAGSGPQTVTISASVAQKISISVNGSNFDINFH